METTNSSSSPAQECEAFGHAAEMFTLVQNTLLAIGPLVPGVTSRTAQLDPAVLVREVVHYSLSGSSLAGSGTLHACAQGSQIGTIEVASTVTSFGLSASQMFFCFGCRNEHAQKQITCIGSGRLGVRVMALRPSFCRDLFLKALPGTQLRVGRSGATS